MRVCFLILLGVLAATESVLASVLAVDYGTDWMKASLMKPGVPFDVLLNRDSKRKIQASVGWKGRDRLFGSDAFNMATRFPKDSFSNLKYLQGQTSDADAVAFFTSISTADIVETARKTVGLRKSDDTEWTVEELMAMQFAYVKDLAETTVKDKVKDVVVTVPPFFSQFERQAVLDAIEISGLKPIALLNDGTAVAVNYALTRTFQIPETHIIYDAGAGAIRATVVTFSSVAVAPSDGASKVKSKSKGNTTVIESKAIGYVRGVGGNEFDRRLREILVDDFNNKHNKDIRKDARGMAKLWKEAGRVKSVLSANALAASTVESVAFDIDYRSKISRDTFEESLKDLEPLFTKPITDALANAGLTLDDITSVIFMGGTSRTPIIQQAVKSLVGEAKIAQNVNTDEAAVLGAAFYGASISSQFKTKNIKVVDITPYDVQVSYLAEAKIPGSRPRTISTVLFPAGSKLGAKKTLTLKRKDDIELVLSYKSPVKGVFPAEISQAQITGVSEAFGNLTERGATSPVIKVTIILTESGFAVVQDAVAFGEIKDESIAGKLKGFFGGAASSETPSAEASEETSSLPAPSPTPEKEKSAKEKDQSTIALNVDVAPLSIHPLTYREKQASRERLVAIDQAERAKQRREDARNVLEAYLYRLRDLLDSDSSSTFMTYSKESERSELSRQLEETFHWLSESGDAAEIIDIWGKTDALEAIEKPVQRRHQEAETLIPAIAEFEKALIAGHTFLESARQNYTLELVAEAPHKYTLEEIEDVSTRLNDSTTWLKEFSAKQKGLAINDDPVLLTDEVRARGMALQNHVIRLMRRKAPKPKKTSTSEVPSATATDSSAEDATATDTETIPTATEKGRPIKDHDEL
ncbi:Hsp70 protein-domain-containing protein [Hysterangium stoloniferum]|nr:Hsp70 protein-domain-containing protein [Hysterangium stoloniferum]